MVFLLVILFAISLIYLSLSQKETNYFRGLAVQGVLLFGIAIVELNHFDTWNLLFILAETIVVKSIFVPLFLSRVHSRHVIHHKPEKKSKMASLFPVAAVVAIIIISFVLSHSLHDTHIEAKYFAISTSALLMGILMIVTNKKMLVHLIGYIIIENGIFLLALAVGGEMPMLINTGVLLDVFASILVLGIFLDKVGDHTNHELDTDNFTDLKD